DVQQEVRLSVAPRRRSYGRVRVSGVVWWMDTDITDPDNLYIGHAINHGRISAYVSYHIDEVEVEVDGNGDITTAPYNTWTSLYTRLGTVPETAYTQMSSVFGVADARGDGIATALWKLNNYED